MTPPPSSFPPASASQPAPAARHQALAQEVARAGYYPEVVLGVLDTALAGEDVESYLVQPETTFAEGLHRHLTALVLTPSRLIIVHVDDAVGEDSTPMALATSEAVALGRIQAVGVTHGVARPAEGGTLTEVTLAISWGAVRRLEIEPAQCPDPTCDADHGMTGVTMPDDIVVRVSAGVEGREALTQAQLFARALSGACARGGAVAAGAGGGA